MIVIKQAQNLKGQLAKHPIKRDINKLKAVQTLYKKFIQPDMDKHTNSLQAPDLTSIKKSLSDGKFANVLEYNLKTSIEQSGFRGNSFYFLEDKTYKLRERIEGVLMDLARKIDKAQLESIKVDIGSGNVSAVQKGDDRRKKIATSGGESEIVKEDGHTDVASSKRKVMIMVDDSNKLLNKLNGMNKEDSLPSWWSDKITLSQNYLQKATNYLLNPVEEAIDYKKNTPKSLKKSNFKSLDILVPKGREHVADEILRKL